MEPIRLTADEFFTKIEQSQAFGLEVHIGGEIDLQTYDFTTKKTERFCSPNIADMADLDAIKFMKRLTTLLERPEIEQKRAF